MKKYRKIVIKIFGGLIALALILMYIVWPIMRTQTKKHSPEQNITYTQGDLELHTFYNSPSKKGRDIFGDLVPYNEVWRTGANEPTTFTTNKDLLIDGKELPTGTYTVWTIPGETSWNVIFNSKIYKWGVSFSDQSAAREARFDVVEVTVTPSKSLSVTESFTISFTESGEDTLMLLSWDTTVVPVLLKEK